MNYADAKITFGDSPPPDVAARFELEDLGLEISSEVQAVVRIRNRSGVYLHARSAAPVRLSWRFIREGSINLPWWEARTELNGDIPPGGEQTDLIEAVLPKEPGSYRLQVSMVADGRYWFHDKGMRILTFSEPIVVR